MGSKQEKRGRQPQRRIPSESSFFSKRQTRRAALALGTGAAAATGLTLLGLGQFGDSSEPLEPTPRNDKERLLFEINSLPDSRVKELLVERIEPFFKKYPSPAGNFGDMKFQVHDANVTSVFGNDPNPLSVVGHSTSRGGLPPEQYLLEKDMFFPFPLTGILTPDEVSKYPKSSILPDGTPIILVKISAEQPVYQGYSYQITIERERASKIPKQYQKHVENVVRFVVIKEACGLLLEGMMTELAYEKMKSSGIETQVEVRRVKDGSVNTIELMPQLALIIQEQHGRWEAGLDAAAYIIALKAIENTDLVKNLKVDPFMKAVIDTLPTFDLGNSIPEIVASSFAWALNFLKNNKLNIVGDINKIP